jgi:septal ring factor EnvC (AmiA/AmiB activator)
MIPYWIREERGLGKNVLEIVAAVAALGVFAACAIVHLPNLDQVTHTAQARERQQHRQSLAQLQTATSQLQTREAALQAELAKMARLLESTKADLARLTEGHNTLDTRVASATAKLQKIETTVQETGAHAAKISEFISLHQLMKERDEATAESQRSADQIRDLTLKLQRAGIYP